MASVYPPKQKTLFVKRDAKRVMPELVKTKDVQREPLYENLKTMQVKKTNLSVTVCVNRGIRVNIAKLRNFAPQTIVCD